MVKVSNSTTLVFDDVGGGDAVVFLHGFPFNRSMWSEQIEFLSGHGYRAIAPDLRGLGESVAQTLGSEGLILDHRLKSVPLTTMDQMARDVATLLDELDIDRAIICGLSMGAYVAFEFVHLFPSKTMAVVLAGARAQGPDEAEKHSRAEQARRVMAEGMGAGIESILAKLLARKTLGHKPDVVSRTREMILSTNPRGAAAAQRGMAARRDYSSELANITVPTLIIAGRDDGVRKPEDAEFIHRGVRGSQLVTIDDAGHLMNMEQPEIFNDKLLTFLELIH